MKAELRAFGISALLLISSSAESVELYKLSDLSARQQAQLFEQVDAYGLLTGFLNSCKRPPHMVERLSSIAKDCVEDGSFQLVVKRFNDAVLQNSGPYKCDAPGFAEHVAAFEAKIEAVVSNFVMACRLHSFAGASFPNAGVP
jgi:hypothetical protein